MLTGNDQVSVLVFTLYFGIMKSDYEPEIDLDSSYEEEWILKKLPDDSHCSDEENMRPANATQEPR